MARPKNNENELSPRERAFAERYNIHGNGQKAAVEAGYKEGSARQTAYRLMQKPAVKGLLNELRRVTSMINQLEASEVLSALAAKIRVDIRRYYNEDGSIKNVHELDDEAAKIVVEFETKDQFDQGGNLLSTTHKVKIPDNMPAIAAAMRHFGLFEKDNKQSQAMEGLAELFEIAASNPISPRQEAAQQQNSVSKDAEDDESAK